MLKISSSSSGFLVTTIEHPLANYMVDRNWYTIFIMDSLINLKPDQQQRDDAPGNFREKQIEKLTRFLRLTFLEIFNNRKIEDVLKDEEAIRKLVTDISNDEYVSVLGTLILF